MERRKTVGSICCILFLMSGMAMAQPFEVDDNTIRSAILGDAVYSALT